MFLPVWQLPSCTCGAPFLTRSRVCLLSVIVRSTKSIVKISFYSHFTCYTCFMYIQYIEGFSQPGSYSRSCSIICSLRYNGSLNTWTVVRLTATKFEPLILVRSVSGFAFSHIVRTLAFPWFCTSSACCLLHTPKCMEYGNRKVWGTPPPRNGLRG
jgi:hypothetical protein